MNIYDVVIIGSGPAGYTAAIYTSRAFLKTLVISGPQPGGQLTTTTEVENFPGFPEGIQGSELLQKMKAQAEKFGAEIITDVISNIKFKILNSHIKNKRENTTFALVGQNQEYEAKSVIIATGAQAKMLGIPSEEKFRGKGISYCATCDGFFFRGKNVAVIGGGDTAMEEATFLTRFAEKVTIIHRREEFRASPIMVERAKKNPKINFLLNKEIVEFYGDDVLRGVHLRDGTNETNMTNMTQPSHKASSFAKASVDKPAGEAENLDFDGVFVAIGHIPATEFLKDIIELDEKGYIILKTKIKNQKSKIQSKNQKELNTMTSVDGIFAAGDCVDSHYKQAVVAAGMGCMAAMDVERYLQR